jgi:signal transduction protein with GAF and PtsI domain
MNRNVHTDPLAGEAAGVYLREQLGKDLTQLSAFEPVKPARALVDVSEKSDIDLLHEIGSRLAAADPLHAVLSRVVDFVSSVVLCDSCFVYVLDEDALVLRASKTPHPDVVDRLKLRVGEGITGWVAAHRQPVAVGTRAFEDPRFQTFNELPEDKYEAFLSVPVLSRGKLVGVINLQHRQPHNHSRREIQIISTIGFLVGAEIEMARLEGENTELSERLETRKILDRAKGILQRDLGLTEEDSYLTIQRQSRQRRKTKKEIAEAIILADELRRGKPSS